MVKKRRLRLKEAKKVVSTGIAKVVLLLISSASRKSFARNVA